LIGGVFKSEKGWKRAQGGGAKLRNGDRVHFLQNYPPSPGPEYQKHPKKRRLGTRLKKHAGREAVFPFKTWFFPLKLPFRPLKIDFSKGKPYF
jgi:hypothetical protein